MTGNPRLARTHQGVEGSELLSEVAGPPAQLTRVRRSASSWAPESVARPLQVPLMEKVGPTGPPEVQEGGDQMTKKAAVAFLLLFTLACQQLPGLIGVTENTSIALVGVYDWSASVPYLAEDEVMWQGIISDLQPGDWLHLRLIGSSSYSPELVVVDLPLPLNSLTSPLWAVDQGVEPHKSAKADALAKLETLNDRPHEQNTDIYGALAAAGEVLAGAHAYTRHVLVVASDFEDTVSDRVELDFSGVEVILLLRFKDRLAEARAGAEAWTRTLRASGAGPISVLPPGQRLALEDLRLSPDRRKNEPPSAQR